MTSSIPMFIPKVVLNKSAYFENCITDPIGFLEKIKKENFLNEWQNCNPDSKDCFDIKLYHSRNNLYKKELDLKTQNDLKKDYIINSIKMAFLMSSELYCKAFGLVYNKSNSATIYRQDSSSIFDEYLKKEDEYLAILFLNDGEFYSSSILQEGVLRQQINPKAGSVLIVDKNTFYNVGYLLNQDRYYCTYKFKSESL